MLKILKNTTIATISIDDTGISIDAGEQYMIEPRDYLLWTRSEDVITEILANNIVVNDGEDDLHIRYAVALIQDNQILMSEYYTLVQGDDVLVGNGQILYLNEDFPTTDNIDYEDDDMTEILEEDFPPSE